MSIRQCASIVRAVKIGGGLSQKFVRRPNFRAQVRSGHRSLCVKLALTDGDVVANTFGAPLPPVEMAIDAERVEVSAGIIEGGRGVAPATASVVQQLRGSAPYVDLHRDSTMVVHLCIVRVPQQQ